jgi:uncharacterized protein
VTPRPGCLVVVLAKNPAPGQVKTRLIPVLGAQGAAEIHRRMVRHTLSTAVAAFPGQVELWVTPDRNDPFFAGCAAKFGVTLEEQSTGDLGRKMQHAIEAGLTRARSVLLTGTDCPMLSASYLHAASAALVAGNDVVLGPTEDGGYALLGVRRPCPAIFSGVSWGSRAVLSETRLRLAEAGLRWQEMPLLWDVDVPEDVARVAADQRLRRLVEDLVQRRAEAPRDPGAV